ncbi:response regulator transcription factor [Pedobacter sp. SYSU D00535]|uniref:response regulator transcription factor n=1 Tax=Pedobacter sp. SYSU D00535 TaxID=2810308 RepID=UPI001A9708BC|nr:LuxR C-terminal-related transcriptional regulator [Pedobacter sp. SYSU D00535]
MLNSSGHNKILPGLVDSAVEFFVDQHEVKCVHDGRTYSFENFPEWIIELVKEDMLQHPEAIKALASWENLHESEHVRQYIYCRFGGLDNDADIDVDRGIHYAEYFDCGLRGSCKYEGKLCCSVQVSNGYLTKTEIEILKRISKANKLIADELCISCETVNSHIQNIMKKTGLAGKVELAIFATKKGMI